MSVSVEAQTTTVRYEFVPQLPGHRAVLPVEEEGRLTFLVSAGAMSEQCLDELNEYAHHITNKRLWNQNWGGSPAEPPHLRQVS